MNWLLIVIIGMIAGFLLWGYCRGFLRMMLTLVSGIVVWVLACWMTPYASQWLIEHTAIENTVEQYSLQRIREVMGSNENAAGVLEEFGFSIPEGELLFEGAEENLEEWLDQMVYVPLAEKIGTWIINGIAFLVILLLLGIFAHILVGMIDMIEKIPVIGTANRIFGILAGGGLAILLIWIFMGVVSLCSIFGGCQRILSYINEAEFLKWLYDHNLLLQFLLRYLLQ